MILDWCKNLVFAGHIDENSSDARKQIIFNSLFCLIATVLLTIFGIDGLYSGKILLATIVLTFSAVNTLNYLYLRSTGNYRVSSMVTVSLMILLSFYLLATGGNENTGPLWLFVMPSMVFYTLGLRRGRYTLIFIFLMILFILYVPDNILLHTTYPPAFIHRFVGSFFSISIIAFAYEYTREDGRKELLALSHKLDKLSRKDELTGLSNRRDIYEKLQEELCRFERSGHIFSVIIADLDHFKRVNDTYGHDCGDYVLREVAKTLTQNTQKRDTVARWGGEEFLIFLPGTKVQHAQTVAERLRRAVAALELSYKDQSLTTTMSMGIAAYRAGTSLSQLIHTADTRLYRAKKEGRNRAISSVR